MVEMTNEEFQAIFEALQAANSGYTMDEVAKVVALEGKAWTLVQEIAARQET